MAVITSSATTLGELRDHVYFLADEEPNGVFQVPSVNRLINMGIRHVLARIGVNAAPASTQYFEGIRSYQLPNATLAFNRATVESVRILPEGATEWLELVSADYSPTVVTATGVPGGYSMLGNTLYFDVIPDGFGEVEVVYDMEFQNLTDDVEISPLNDHGNEIACTYAVMQMKLRDDEVAVSDRWRQMYEQLLRTVHTPATGVYKGA